MACGSIDGLLCPGLGGDPVGGAGLSKFDGGFAGGFVLGEGLVELGEDFVCGFDRKEGEAFNVANLIINTRIECCQYIFSYIAI